VALSSYPESRNPAKTAHRGALSFLERFFIFSLSPLHIFYIGTSEAPSGTAWAPVPNSKQSRKHAAMVQFYGICTHLPNEFSS